MHIERGDKQAMFKTSISLPKSLIGKWAQRRSMVEAKLPGLLIQFRKSNPCRNRLCRYTRCAEPFVRLSVYWPIVVYNELHSVAATLRVSVSHLLWIILQRLESGDSVPEAFLKYSFKALEWSGQRMHCMEILEFSPGAPDPP